ncbi:MAG TPA: hypothetical protein VF484_00095 [Candidatus Limnocylindrales bacterium]
MTVVGLGTAAMAGAAIALAVATPQTGRRRRPARGHPGGPIRSSRAVSDPFESDGSALFV